MTSNSELNHDGVMAAADVALNSPYFNGPDASVCLTLAAEMCAAYLAAAAPSSKAVLSSATTLNDHLTRLPDVQREDIMRYGVALASPPSAGEVETAKRIAWEHWRATHVSQIEGRNGLAGLADDPDDLWGSIGQKNRDAYLAAARAVQPQPSADREVQRLVEHFGGEEEWRAVARKLLAWAAKNLPVPAVDALSTTYDGVMAMHSMMQAALPHPAAVREALEEARAGLVAYTGGTDGACGDTIAKIDAALSSAGEQGWRPISEAPRNGTLVDLWFPGEIGRQTDFRFIVDAVTGPDGAWLHKRRDGTTIWFPNALPTHFRPLPAPPASTDRER